MLGIPQPGRTLGCGVQPAAGGDLRPETLPWVEAGEGGHVWHCCSGSPELGWFLGLPATPPGRSRGPPASRAPQARQEGGAVAASVRLCQGGGFRRPFPVLPRTQRDERSPRSSNIACSVRTSAYWQGWERRHRWPWRPAQGCSRGSAGCCCQQRQGCRVGRCEGIPWGPTSRCLPAQADPELLGGLSWWCQSPLARKLWQFAVTHG